MGLLKRENWFVNLILMLLTQGFYTFALARMLNLYKKDAWYRDYRYWVIAILFFFFPIFLLLIVFLVQMLCTVASKLNVPGKEIYGYPYAWILCLIVPIVGWTLLIVMWIYLLVWTTVMLARGEGELYLKWEEETI